MVLVLFLLVDVGFHGRVAEGELLPSGGEHNDANLSTAENGELTCFLEEILLVVLNIGLYKWYSICYIWTCFYFLKIVKAQLKEFDVFQCLKVLPLELK